jgi:hypothetical protein
MSVRGAECLSAGACYWSFGIGMGHIPWLGSVTPTAWEYILTYGSFFVVAGGFIALSYWGYRRRRS